MMRLFAGAALAATAAAAAAKKPHVIFMLADVRPPPPLPRRRPSAAPWRGVPCATAATQPARAELHCPPALQDLGYSDVQMHGGTQIPTPNLQALADDGVMLSQYYVQPVCSPTRATILTGRHVIHTGVYDPMNGGSGDLSLNFTLLPQHMADLGYASHMVGKWHLGMSSWRFTPLKRGFESYFGYLGGAEDYFIHGTETELDFWSDETPVFNHSCFEADACPHETYSVQIFAKKATEVIERVVTAGIKPLFLYLAWQSVHSGGHLRLQAPQDYIDSFNDTVSNDLRRSLAGMVHALDIGVGDIRAAIKAQNIQDNTLIVFSTDNGGPADHFNGNMGCNFPLRGMKRTLWEGGVRGVGLISGSGLTKKGITLDGFIHAADWMPTLLTAAGGGNGFDSSTPWHERLHRQAAGEPPMQLGDGIDLWPYLSGHAPASPRTEIIHEAHAHNSTDGNGNALRVGEWKIVLRTGGQWSSGSRFGPNDGWFGGKGSTDTVTGAYAVTTGKDDENWIVKCPPPPDNITTGFACMQRKGAGADDPKFACLFHIASDPCEHKDLSAAEPAKLHALLARLEVYRATSVISTLAHPNPDGGRCPGTATVPGCTGPGLQMNCSTQMPCTAGPDDRR